MAVPDGLRQEARKEDAGKDNEEEEKDDDNDDSDNDDGKDGGIAIVKVPKTKRKRKRKTTTNEQQKFPKGYVFACEDDFPLPPIAPDHPFIRLLAGDSPRDVDHIIAYNTFVQRMSAYLTACNLYNSLFISYFAKRQQETVALAENRTGAMSRATLKKYLRKCQDDDDEREKWLKQCNQHKKIVQQYAYFDPYGKDDGPNGERWRMYDVKDHWCEDDKEDIHLWKGTSDPLYKAYMQELKQRGALRLCQQESCRTPVYLYRTAPS